MRKVLKTCAAIALAAVMVLASGIRVSAAVHPILDDPNMPDVPFEVAYVIRCPIGIYYLFSAEPVGSADWGGGTFPVFAVGTQVFTIGVFGWTDDPLLYGSFLFLVEEERYGEFGPYFAMRAEEPGDNGFTITADMVGFGDIRPAFIIDFESSVRVHVVEDEATPQPTPPPQPTPTPTPQPTPTPAPVITLPPATGVVTTEGLVAVIPPTPVAGQDLRYTVQAGETLWSIAFNFYGSMQRALVDRIFLANAELLRPTNGSLTAGMVLTLPAQGLRVPVTQHALADAAGMYLVQRGDTLGALAQRFYGNANYWRRIYEANNDHVRIVAGSPMIFDGQWLVIPG